MSTNAEIAFVHRAESKMKLKPHIAFDRPMEFNGRPLRVTLKDLLSPEAYAKLKELGLIL